MKNAIPTLTIIVCLLSSCNNDNAPIETIQQELLISHNEIRANLIMDEFNHLKARIKIITNPKHQNKYKIYTKLLDSIFSITNKLDHIKLYKENDLELNMLQFLMDLKQRHDLHEYSLSQLIKETNPYIIHGLGMIGNDISITIMKEQYTFIFQEIAAGLLRELKSYVNGDHDFRNNKIYSYIYSSSSELTTGKPIMFHVGLAGQDTNITPWAIIGDYTYDSLGNRVWTATPETLLQNPDKLDMIYVNKFDTPGVKVIRGLYFLPINDRVNLPLPIKDTIIIK